MLNNHIQKPLFNPKSFAQKNAAVSIANTRTPTMSNSIISHHYITTITTTTNRHEQSLTTTLSPQLKPTTLTPSLSLSTRRTRAPTTTAAARTNNTNPKNDDVEEVEEDMPWMQEKALDIVEFSGSVTQALPGPRVGQSSVPWLLALPLAYVGVSFVFAFVKTVKKFTSPKQARRNKINKNATLCRSIDELLEKEGSGLQHEALKELMQKTGFSMVDILRKYIRYALNEKPFNPQMVAALIHLRKITLMDDSQVAEILNEISKLIVKKQGPVVMNTSGYTEKGLMKKLAVQALFGKIFYLSELPEFCGRDGSLIVKEIFGVADEDAERLRLHTVAEAGDMDSLEKMVDGSGSGSDSDDSGEGSS